MKFNLLKLKNFFEDKNLKDNIFYLKFDETNFNINNKYINNYINKILNKKILNKDLGSYIILYNFSKFYINKFIIINSNNKNKFYKNYLFILNKCIEILKIIKSKNIYIYLENIINKNNLKYKIDLLVKTFRKNFYIFDKFKKNDIKKINSINIILNEEYIQISKKIIKKSNIISDAIDLTKNMCNLPSNICDCEYISKECYKLSKINKNIKYKFLNKKDIKKAGMNAYFSVCKGNKKNSIMNILEYDGNNYSIDKFKNNFIKKPIILIGKGLTFDTGGVSLKPSIDMDEMKFDMSGAACVLYTIYAINKLKLPIKVIGILSTTENSIGNNSMKPGDIVVSLSKKTIEIINTDAEGRLVLCDSITYCYKYDPEIIIDIATLTGACLIALGRNFSAVISNNKNLIKDFKKASYKSNDKIWQLPLIKENQNQIKSNIADLKNVGDGEAGTITAACFLYNFIKKNTKWLHIDIAGSSVTKNKNSTGRPVELLIQFLIEKSKKYLKNNKIYDF